jgi:endonuclease YncB( thermonuclease family)
MYGRFVYTTCLLLLVVGCDALQGEERGGSDEGSEHARATQGATSGECRNCRVVELKGCYDGDTCRFSTFSKNARLARIDTPEMDGACRSEAKAAKRALLKRLRAASQICVTKTGVGYYDRPLVEVCADGDNVNNWLMDEGYAVDYGKSTCDREDEGSDSDGSDEGASNDESGSGPCHAPDVDCSELDSCEEARRYLCEGDPHDLDGDGNGVPCESLCR